MLEPYNNGTYYLQTGCSLNAILCQVLCNFTKFLDSLSYVAPKSLGIVKFLRKNALEKKILCWLVCIEGNESDLLACILVLSILSLLSTMFKT